MSKQPQSGEYWQSNNDSPVFIVGVKQNGDVIFENKHGIHFNGGKNWHAWRHLPDCDSFGWVPETWPKYYVHFRAFRDDAEYIRRDSKNSAVSVSKSGAETKIVWDADRDEIVASGGWIEVTEAEAKSRLNPPKPDPGQGYRRINPAVDVPQVGDEFWHKGEKRWVARSREMSHAAWSNTDTYRRRIESPKPAESPDDWVAIADHGHVIRDCDQISDYGTQWYAPSSMTGALGKRFCEVSFHRVRCRREDLPPNSQTRTVVLREWLVWEYAGRETIEWSADEPAQWKNFHPTGLTRTIEVPE